MMQTCTQIMFKLKILYKIHSSFYSQQWSKIIKNAKQFSTSTLNEDMNERSLYLQYSTTAYTMHRLRVHLQTDLKLMVL